MKIPHFSLRGHGDNVGIHITCLQKKTKQNTREQKIDQVHDMDMHGCDLLVEWKLRPIS